MNDEIEEELALIACIEDADSKEVQEEFINMHNDMQ